MQEKKGHYKLNHNIVGSISMHMYFAVKTYPAHIIRKALLKNQVGKMQPHFRFPAKVEQTINRT